MLVVLDTNVLVSGLLNGSGSHGRVLDMVVEGRIQVAYDDRIMGEYEDVLMRPELALKRNHVDAILAYIELTGTMIDAEPISISGFTDPDDLSFAEVFLSGHAEALISGNLRHFAPLIDAGMAVLSPSAFLERFEKTRS